MDSEAFRSFLQYLYTGTVTLDETNAVHLLEASHQYQLPELKESCIQFAAKTLQPEDVLEYLRVAVFCNEMQLVDRCFTFIDERTEEILHTESILRISKELFSQILQRDSLRAPEVALFSALLLWREKNDGQAAKELARLIRIPQMDAKDIIKTVKPSKLVSEEILFASMAFHAAPEEYTNNPEKMFQPRAVVRNK